jgi:hypothetical protein
VDLASQDLPSAQIVARGKTPTTFLRTRRCWTYRDAGWRFAGLDVASGRLGRLVPIVLCHLALVENRVSVQRL